VTADDRALFLHRYYHCEFVRSGKNSVPIITVITVTTVTTVIAVPCLFNLVVIDWTWWHLSTTTSETSEKVWVVTGLNLSKSLQLSKSRI
jgi:hypothetical protein